MKKLTGLILIIAICISLAACVPSGSQSGGATFPSNDASITLWFDSLEAWLDNYEKVIAQEEQQAREEYKLLITKERDDELKYNGFSEIDVDRKMEAFEPWLPEEKLELQKLYDMRANKPLVLPVIANAMPEYCDEGAVIWMSSELFGLSWLWFRLENNTMIKVSFLESEYLLEPDISGVDISLKFNPSFPTPSNYSYKDFKKVYEKKIQLQDQKVTAMVREYRSDWERTEYYFVYGDMFVRVIGAPDAVTEDWLAGLSFKQVSRYSEIGKSDPK